MMQGSLPFQNCHSKPKNCKPKNVLLRRFRIRAKSGSLSKAEFMFLRQACYDAYQAAVFSTKQRDAAQNPSFAS
jgi:hypothetical protein